MFLKSNSKDPSQTCIYPKQILNETRFIDAKSFILWKKDILILGISNIIR